MLTWKKKGVQKMEIMISIIIIISLNIIMLSLSSHCSKNRFCNILFKHPTSVLPHFFIDNSRFSVKVDQPTSSRERQYNNSEKCNGCNTVVIWDEYICFSTSILRAKNTPFSSSLTLSPRGRRKQTTYPKLHKIVKKCKQY